MDDVRVPAVRILAVVLWLAGFALVTVEALGFSEMVAEYGLLIAGVGAMVSHAVPAARGAPSGAGRVRPRPGCWGP